MAVKDTQNNEPAQSDIERYRQNYLSEQEGVHLYRMLADAESDTHLIFHVRFYLLALAFLPCASIDADPYGCEVCECRNISFLSLVSV